MEKFPGNPDRTTLAEGKEWLRNYWTTGALCPCCTRPVKLYRRTITKAMAQALEIIYRFFQENALAQEWVHVPALLASQQLAPRTLASIRGDWAKLRFWGLIGARTDWPAHDTTESKNGYYAITGLGRKFVEGKSKVPKYIYLYNSAVWPVEGGDEKLVGIADVKGTKQ